MAGDNDEIFGAPPRKAASSHEIGQNLDDLSVQEIDERITTLQAEITWLEEVRSAKQTSLSAAASFFKFDEFELRRLNLASLFDPSIFVRVCSQMSSIGRDRYNRRLAPLLGHA